MSLSLGTLSAALEVQDKFSESFEKFEHAGDNVLKKLVALEEIVGAFAAVAIFEKLSEGAETLAELLTKPTEKMIQFAEQIQNAANKTSMSTDSLQVLRVAAEEAGAGFDEITAATARFQTKLGQGSQATLDAVGKLGLSFKKLRDEDPGEALVETLQALDKIPNAMDRAALGTALLGRGFMALLPIGATFDEIREKMQSFGLIMDKNVIATAKEAGAELGFLKEVVNGAERNFGAAITTSAAFHEAIKLVTTMVGQLSKWVQDNQATVRSWVDTGIAFAARAMGVLVAVIGAAMPVVHALYDGWLLLRTEFAYIAIDLRLVIDLFTALKDHSPSEMTAAWTKATQDADKATKDLATSMTKGNEIFKSVDTGISKTMNTLLDFANHVDATNGKIEELGKKTRDNAPSNGDIKGYKDSQDALDAFSAKLESLNSKYQLGVTATSEYARKQAEVTTQSHELQDKLDELGVKFPQIAALTRQLSMDVVDLTKKWHAQVEEAERTKELEAAQQKLTTAADDYDKALQALHPELDYHTQISERLVAQKDLEIDKWLKANPLMADAAAKLHELNHETAALTEQKSQWDSLFASINQVGAGLAALGGAGKTLSGLIDRGAIFANTFKNVGGIGGFKSLLSGPGGLFGGGGKDENGNFVADSLMQSVTKGLGIVAKAIPVASAAVGIIKSIAGLFSSKPEYEKVADELGGKLGVKFSDSTTKAIEATEQTAKVSRGIAELLNLDKVESEVGSFTDKVSSMVGNLMSGIHDKTIPTVQGMDTLDKLFSKSAADGSTAGDTFHAMSIALIKQAEALGEVTPAMQKYLDAAHAMEAAGASQISLGISLVQTTGPQLQQLSGQWGTDAATFFVAGFEEEIATKGLVSALDAEHTNFDKMWKQFETSGNTAAMAVLGPFKQMNDAIEGADTSLKGMITTTEGEDKVFKGLGQTGLMTTDTFDAMERSIGATNDALVAGGISGPNALMAIHGELQDVIDASNAFGIPLDENTRKLIEQSKAAGIAFKTDPIVALTDAIQHLADVLGGTVSKVGDLGTAVNRLPQSLPPYVNSNGTPDTNQNPDGYQTQPTNTSDLPSYAGGTGGFVDFGNETLVALHGVEAVVPKNSSSFTGGIVSGLGGSGSTGAGVSELVLELRGLRQDMSNKVPNYTARAVRDALVKIGALK